MNSKAKHRFTKSNSRLIAGVCGGIAEYFKIDKSLVRILFAALIILTHGFGLLVYILLALIMPSKPDRTSGTFFGSNFGSNFGSSSQSTKRERKEIHNVEEHDEK